MLAARLFPTDWHACPTNKYVLENVDRLRQGQRRRAARAGSRPDAEAHPEADTQAHPEADTQADAWREATPTPKHP